MSSPGPLPTPYPALNSVLEHLLAGAREALSGNFIGAYLQGSCALGDFDQHSDVDFLVVTHEDLTDAEVVALDARHAAIHDLPPPWGHRLEGSYVPASILKLRPADRALWFLDHGSRSLERSPHDDTWVVRWVTREKGIVLAGPDPCRLIDEVPAETLRQEMRDNMVAWPAAWFPDAASIEALWEQALIVVIYCRMLHTLHTGTVTSKRAAADWAMPTL